MIRIALAVAFLAIEPAWAAELVQVESGMLAGIAQDGVREFAGIPYAAAPIGALRWKPPQPPARWSGTRAADQAAPACVQTGSPGRDILKYGGAPEPTSEDCLTLNVWAPAIAVKAPVMLWIHGGSGRFGAGSLPYYNGTSFARDGVVFVTINYRLGNLGTFAHPALTRAAGQDEGLAQYSLMDQIAALKWVRRNILAFGGDPGNVTLLGESAGALDTLVLMTVESARGLFHKAIVESGGGWYPPSNLEDAEKCGVEVATKLGLPGANATAEQLRALSVKQLTTVGQVCGGGLDERLIRDQPTIALAAGRAADIPLIIGGNSGEDSLLDVDDGIARAKATLLAGDAGKSARALYGAVDDETVVRNMFRDSLVLAPARWVAGLPWRSQPAYLYYFDYVDEAQRAKRQRAPHGSDVFHVFETFAARPDGEPPATAADQALAALMHACWVSFARSGKPDCAHGADAWPSYTRDADPWMVFDAHGAHVKHALYASQLDSYEGRVRWVLWLGRIKAWFGHLF